MPVGANSQNNIGGFNPAVSRTQSSAIRVLNGKNFRWDFDGPFSGFGNSQVSEQFTGHSLLPYYATFNVESKAYLFTPNGVFEQRESNDPDKCYTDLICKLAFTPYQWPCEEDNDYPWSQAFVGDSYYFSHPTVGLIKYNTYKCEWSCCELVGEEIENGEGTFYDFSCPEKGCLITGPIFGITQAGNRLVIQARDTIGWSAIDDGCTLFCDPFCGGGFVSSSVARYGKPLGVYETADGFAAFTSNSIIRGATIDSIGAFNVATLSNKTFPINPHAITQLDNFQIMFYSNKGLMLLANNQLAPFEPELSNWFHKLLRNTNIRYVQHGVKLAYAEDTDELFVSVIGKPSEKLNPNVYPRALVYKFISKKWGSFDQPHYFIGPVNVSHKVAGQNLGFISWSNYLHHFDYSLTNSVGAGLELDNLDSFITVGPFQIAYEQLRSVKTELTSFDIHTEVNNSSGFNLGIIDSYQEDFKSSNWETCAFANYDADVYLLSSKDAHGTNENCEQAELLSNEDCFVKNYTCSGVGDYHTISIVASRVGSYYSINMISVQLVSKETKA